MDNLSESFRSDSESWQVEWGNDMDHEELVGQLGDVQHDFEEEGVIEDNTTNRLMPDPAGDILALGDATQATDFGSQFEEFVDVPGHTETTPFVHRPAEEIPTVSVNSIVKSTSGSMWDRMTSRIDEITDFSGRRDRGCTQPSSCPSPGDITMVAVVAIAIALVIYLLMGKGPRIEAACPSAPSGETIRTYYHNPSAPSDETIRTYYHNPSDSRMRWACH